MKVSSLTTAAALGLAATVQASSYMSYTTVTGYFLQDEDSTDASTFDYTQNNFGLINRAYDADDHYKKHNKHARDLSLWQRFYNQVVYLNERAPKNVQYKVLFMGRHGEGWHNAAETYYGTPAWNCYWSLLQGNGTVTWMDADLTPNGVAQALIAKQFWASLIAEEEIHTPDSYFVSPLTRALRTANLTFNGLDLPHGSSHFKPLVKEAFREGVSLHTCDHRRDKSYIKHLFPGWEIERGFTNEDELWNGVTGETSTAQDLRSRSALDSIFSSQSASRDAGLIVSITSHSGEISSILRVLGHRSFSLKTGAVIPVLVKAEKIHVDEEEVTTTAPWTVSAHCTAPPVTSVTSCVCAASATPVTTLLS